MSSTRQLCLLCRKAVAWHFPPKIPRRITGESSLQKESTNREKVTSPEPPTKQTAKLFPCFNTRVKFPCSAFIVCTRRAPLSWRVTPLSLLLLHCTQQSGPSPFVLAFKSQKSLCLFTNTLKSRGAYLQTQGKRWTSFYWKSRFFKVLSSYCFSQFLGPLGQCSLLPHSHPHRKHDHSEITSTLCTEPSESLRPTRSPRDSLSTTSSSGSGRDLLERRRFQDSPVLSQGPSRGYVGEKFTSPQQLIHTSRFLMPSAPPWTYFWLQLEILELLETEGQRGEWAHLVCASRLDILYFKHP